MSSIVSPARARLAAVLVVATVATAIGLVAVASPASAAAPTIKSFTPTTGPFGNKVTITGTNLSIPQAKVLFGGTAGVATPISQTASTVVVDVPVCAVSGALKFVAGDFSATSTSRFTVSRSVGASPSSGMPGAAITICGATFTKGELIDVYFDGTDIGEKQANLLTGTFTFATTIPASATPGTHWITAVGRKDGVYAQGPVTVHTDWSQDGDNGQLDRANPYENVLNASNVSNLGQAWSNQVGAAGYTAAPVVANGVVYSTSQNGGLVALDETTGHTLWTFALQAPATGSPVVANGVVYVGDYYDNVYAINAASGAQIWTVLPYFGDVDGGITYSNGVLYMLQAYNTAGEIDALSARDGTELWSYSLNNLYPQVQCDLDTETLAVASNIVVVPCDGHLFGLNASTGAVVWNDTNVADDSRNSPTIFNGAVYVSDWDSVSAFKLANGAAMWKDTMTTALGGDQMGGIAAHGGSIYVGLNNNMFYALNALTGTTLWSFNAGDAAGSPAWANGVVYFGGLTNGYLYALDANDGTDLWSYPSGGGSPIAVTDGQMFVTAGGAVTAWHTTP